MATFDADEGLGTIDLDDGQTVGFHATQLADGSRQVAVGARVTASVRPWHLGALEATEIEVDGPPSRAPC